MEDDLTLTYRKKEKKNSTNFQEIKGKILFDPFGTLYICLSNGFHIFMDLAKPSNKLAH